jgi:hypothetical protein
MPTITRRYEWPSNFAINVDFINMKYTRAHGNAILFAFRLVYFEINHPSGPIRAIAGTIASRGTARAVVSATEIPRIDRAYFPRCVPRA